MNPVPEVRPIKNKKCRSPNVIFSIKKIKNQKKWTLEEDELLIALAEKYNEKHWKEISKRFDNKNPLQCFSRYKRIRPGIIKGSWKKEEDEAIKELVLQHGKSWSKISKLLGTRNGKQIRDRFINVLDSTMRKGKFTEEEDDKLIELFKQYGPKWATIAKYYPNRTADMIKNRFHSSIKKKVLLDHCVNPAVLQEINEYGQQYERHEPRLDDYCKLNVLNRSNTSDSQNSNSTNYNYNSPNNNDIIMTELDNNEAKSSYYSHVCKEDSEIYTSCLSNNIFSNDFLTCDYNVKVENDNNYNNHNTMDWSLDKFFNY